MSYCDCCGVSRVEIWEKANVFNCTACGYKKQRVIKPFNYGKEYIEKSYSHLMTLEMSWIRLTVLFSFLKQGFVLDIGYGDGEFVRQARRVGYEAFGFDVHKDDFNIPTFMNPPPGWDAVCMFDSFEHMKDLSEPFKLDPEYFIVTIPNVPGTMDEESLMVWRHYKPDEHLHYFTPKALSRFFARRNYGRCVSYPYEDLIRRQKDVEANTMTYVFKKETGI